jgi:hypothetical protein
MNTPGVRPWWPESLEDAAALALQLRKDSAALQLMEFIAITAASQEWEFFSAAMSAICDVSPRSVRNMLDNSKFDSGWTLLYGATGMPPYLLPLFTEILKIARKFTVESGDPASRALRLAVVQQALASPNLRGLRIPPELRAALLA